MSTLSEGKVYIGTYGKYNSGSLEGGYLAPGDYCDAEDFWEDARAMHSNEHDPELMIQDIDGLPRSLVSEHGIDDMLWELLEMDEYDQKKAIAYIDYYGKPSNLEDAVSKCYGQYESEKDFAVFYANDVNGWDKVMENAGIPYYCFDYEAYANSLFSSGFTFTDGWVFSDH